MSRRALPASCPACGAPVPRSAAGRCPSCRTEFILVAQAAGMARGLTPRLTPKRGSAAAVPLGDGGRRS